MKNKKDKKGSDRPADAGGGCPEQPLDGSQGRPTYHTGSTVQGGSDFGQGSHYLAGDAYKQGQVKNDGANYGNEAGRLSELSDAGDS